MHLSQWRSNKIYYWAHFLFLATVIALSFTACCDEQSCTGGTVGPIDVNDPPSIQEQADTLCVVGDTLSLHAIAIDPNGDEITYHLRVAPHGEEERYEGEAFLDSKSGQFLFAPRRSDMPDRSITFIATDEHGYSASTTFNVAVWPFYLDQANNVSLNLGQNVVAFSPVGQEFVPNLSALEIVELYLGGGPTSADFKVNIRSGTITGSIVGESDVVTVKGNFFFGAVSFGFERVTLTPHETYVIELTHVSGDSRQWMVYSAGAPTYPYGRQILRGEPRENNDLWFLEGIKKPASDGKGIGG